MQLLRCLIRSFATLGNGRLAAGRLARVPARWKVQTEEETQAQLNDFHAQQAGDFANFPISDATKETLNRMGIKYLFPIQTETFGPIYQGYDLIGKDRTGSGKTIAFTLPIIEKLRSTNGFSGQPGRRPVLMVLVPTRELCVQVAREVIKLRNSPTEFSVTAVYGGGERGRQIKQIVAGTDVVVVTPGRAMDLINDGYLSLSDVRSVVLDETDEMLNIGFSRAIQEIFAVIKQQLAGNKREIESVQFLLFSATIPPFVHNISRLFMKKDTVLVDLVKSSEVTMPQTIRHYAATFANTMQKATFLKQLLYKLSKCGKRALVFTNKKSDADFIADFCADSVRIESLHGDVSQDRREAVLDAFRNKRLFNLVATDVAARGLDIPNIDIVVQLSPSQDAEKFVHRCGRTGRAGKEGATLTMICREELQSFEEYVRNNKITVDEFENSDFEQKINEESEKSTLAVDASKLDFKRLFGSNRGLFERESLSRSQIRAERTSRHVKGLWGKDSFWGGRESQDPSDSRPSAPCRPRHRELGGDEQQSDRGHNSLFGRQRRGNFLPDEIGEQTEERKYEDHLSQRNIGLDPQTVSFNVRLSQPREQMISVVFEFSKLLNNKFLEELGNAFFQGDSQGFIFPIRKERVEEFERAFGSLENSEFTLKRCPQTVRKGAASIVLPAVPASVTLSEVRAAVSTSKIKPVSIKRVSDPNNPNVLKYTAEFEEVDDAVAVSAVIERKSKEKEWLRFELVGDERPKA